MTEEEATQTTAPEPCRRGALLQSWTTTGYPIVDGKYLDLSTGTVKTVGANEMSMSGPPALEVYWTNRKLTGRKDQFVSVVTSAFVDVTEYVRRVGTFLGNSSCQIMALNATKYAVNIIVATDYSWEVMRSQLRACDLLNARPHTQ